MSSGNGKREKRNKSSSRDTDDSTAFIIGSPNSLGDYTTSPRGNALFTNSPLQQSSTNLDQSSSIRSSTSGLAIPAGNRFLSSSNTGYGAISSSDPYYHGDDDDDRSLLLPASVSISPLAQHADSTGAAQAAPLTPSAQEILARFMAAQSSASTSPERRKNVVGANIGGSSDTKDSFCSCNTNMIAVLILIVVIATASIFGIVFYARSTGEEIVVTPSSPSSPHVIFILADDLGWNSIGYEDYDLSFATPFLTSIAKQGIIMNNYYAQEVCTPARAAILTGRYPLSTGMQYSMIMPTTSWGLDLNETLWPEVGPYFTNPNPNPYLPIPLR